MSGKEPKHRDWVKLWVKEALLGTIREDLTSEERGTWYDFLLLAGNSRIPGVICANKTTAMPVKRIAAILNITEPLVSKCIKKFKESGRITVNRNGLISIVNWGRYQYSDYERQKVYRHKLEYTFEMFCEDYDALDNHKKTGGLGDDLATSRYFWDKYGWSKGDMKGTRICRLFMDTFNAIGGKGKEEVEQVATETLEALQP